MKKIFLLLFLIPVFANAQIGIGIDSTVFRVGKFTIQTRDAESIRHLLSTSDVYDDLLDSLNAKLRKNPKPQNQDNIVIDSVTIGALIGISTYMRSTKYEDVAPYYSRVDAAIKTLNKAGNKLDSLLQRWIVSMDAAANNRNDNIKKDGRKRYVGKN